MEMQVIAAGSMETKITFFSIIVLTCLFLNYNKVTAGQQKEYTAIDSVFHSSVITGLDYVSNNCFKKALAVFDTMQKRFPDHPAPNMYKAATYQSWMLTYRINTFENDLFENAQLAIDKGTRLMEKENNPWLNFYVGAAYGFMALHRFRQHNWIGAYIDGKKGINNFNIALKKSPNLYDCYYGLGSYYYWRTAKSKFIRILIFWMSDKRELGLEQLKLSIDKGRYCSYDATHGLIIAYYHHGDYDKALALNTAAMELSNPPSLGTLYMRGRLMATFGNWVEVKELFRRILKRLLMHPYQSIAYKVECQYWIAEALKNLHQPNKALELTTQALAQSENWIKERELENPIESFNVIKERLKILHDTLKKDLVK